MTWEILLSRNKSKLPPPTQRQLNELVRYEYSFMRNRLYWIPRMGRAEFNALLQSRRDEFTNNSYRSGTVNSLEKDQPRYWEIAIVHEKFPSGISSTTGARKETERAHACLQERPSASQAERKGTFPCSQHAVFLYFAAAKLHTCLLHLWDK